MLLDPATRELLRSLLEGASVEDVVRETIEGVDPAGELAALFGQVVVADVSRLLAAEAHLLGRADHGGRRVLIAQIRRDTLRSLTTRFCDRFGLDERAVLAERGGWIVDLQKMQLLMERVEELELE